MPSDLPAGEFYGTQPDVLPATLPAGTRCTVFPGRNDARDMYLGMWSNGASMCGAQHVLWQKATGLDSKEDEPQREQSYNDASRKTYGGRDAQPAPSPVDPDPWGIPRRRPAVRLNRALCACGQETLGTDYDETPICNDCAGDRVREIMAEVEKRDRIAATRATVPKAGRDWTEWVSTRWAK